MQADNPNTRPDVFTVHYVLKNRIGELVDTSEGSEPLHFIYGSPEIIAGIQEAVKDRNVGDCLHPLVWQPLVQRHNGCRITAEQGVGKGIDLINRCGVHRFSLLELVR